jgi:hypothetical protein
MPNELPKGEVLVYQTEDGKVKLDVRLEDETVWLSQPLMAELFQTTQQNINLHILNIYEEGELIEGDRKNKRGGSLSPILLWPSDPFR